MVVLLSHKVWGGFVWMWELDYEEGWAPKNWCFWTAVLEKTFESLLDCKEIKSVNPKEINPEYSLEGLMLKLKLQNFGHLMWRVNSLEKTLMLGKVEGRRRGGDRGWDGWMASPTWWTRVWATQGVGDGQGGLACCSPWGSQRVWHDSTTASSGHVWSSGEMNGIPLTV